MEEKKILSTHSLMLENRQNGRITGVKDIKSFDEKEILLFTCLLYTSDAADEL